MFAPLAILSFVVLSIRPLFPTLSVLFIFKPEAFVPSTIGMTINSFTTCLIIQPLSFVYISVRMVQNSISISLITSPLSDVSRTISPDLLPLTLPLPILPLTFIRNSIVKFYLCHFSPTDWRNHLANQFIIFVTFPPSNKIFTYLSRLSVFFWGSLNVLWITWQLLLWLLSHCRIFIFQPGCFLQMI